MRYDKMNDEYIRRKYLHMTIDNQEQVKIRFSTPAVGPITRWVVAD